MREAHPRDREVGMAWYVSEGDGIGGRLREKPADFRVREIEGVDPEPVSADAAAYPHLLLRVTVRNWDTNQFAARLAAGVGASRERVQWAGTKDRRAVTTQLFSIDGVDPAALPEIPGADIEVVGRFGRSLEFGDLVGNQFGVTVREVIHAERVSGIVAELEAYAGGADSADAREPIGVPNYFGHQRFGSLRPITHEVGYAIVEEQWEAAVRTYLTVSSEDEPQATQDARETLAGTQDWQAALDTFPNRLGYERAMLHVLADGGSYREALAALPENLRRLFVHAAQSHLFNRIVSRRIEAGLPLTEPLPGDVVCFTEERAGVTVPTVDRLQHVTDERVEVVRRHCHSGRAFVTAPLVGTDTTLGGGQPGEIERHVLEEVGIEPASFALPDPYDSTGTRRAILVTTALSVDDDADRVDIEFSLPKGSYATVVLREFLKAAPSMT